MRDLYYEKHKEYKLAISKRWRQNNKERAGQQSTQQYRRDKMKRKEQRLESYNKNPQLYIWEQTRSRAKQYQLDFNITPEDIVIPTHCPIFGIPLIKSMIRTENTPSIDRIDPTHGYIKGNIQIISMRANRLKSNMTLSEIKALYEYVNQKVDILNL